MYTCTYQTCFRTNLRKITYSYDSYDYDLSVIIFDIHVYR